jgi:tripartite-type tricarboxylate transporter receptor subunit TctC
MLKLNWAYIFGIATTLIVLAGFEEKPALAQNYPDKPIKILMPFGPGGAGDVYLRALAPELQSRLGQPVVVENKPGAFTLTGGQACAQSPPDGYTLCMLSIDTTSLAPFLAEKLTFDPMKDFTPITRLFFIGQGLVVHPSIGVNSVSELVSFSKQKPDSMSYVAQASQITLFMEQFKKVTGADMRRVPYTSGGQAATDVLSGHVPIGYFAITNVLQNVEAGQIKFLAVDGTTRSPLLPNVPTLSEAGVPGAPIRAWFGMFAPGNTPKYVVERIYKEITEIMANKAFVERHMISRGLEPAVIPTSDFQAFLRNNRSDAEQLLKTTGLKLVNN